MCNDNEYSGMHMHVMEDDSVSLCVMCHSDTAADC